MALVYSLFWREMDFFLLLPWLTQTRLVCSQVTAFLKIFYSSAPCLSSQRTEDWWSNINCTVLNCLKFLVEPTIQMQKSFSTWSSTFNNASKCYAHILTYNIHFKFVAIWISKSIVSCTAVCPRSSSFYVWNKPRRPLVQYFTVTVL